MAGEAMTAPLWVAKVGGSLYDLPDLAERLRGWLTRVDAGRVLLFPGGGPTADAIRTLDATHRLGEEAAHWLAVQALSVNAHFLARLLPEARVVVELRPEPGWQILDPWPFLRADERDAEHFPHRWQVTSDSLALRAAALAGAEELVLLKSVSWDAADDWGEAARCGVVDGFFAEAVRRSSGVRVRVVNLRRE
jgi:aspartokinase-like uncharacterized kinase